MVRLKILGIVLFITILTGLFIHHKLTGANTNSDQILYWNPDFDLSVDDFKRTYPFLGDEFSATIWTFVDFQEDENGNYSVKAYIDRNKSTFNAAITGTEQEELLTHEKYHANISSVVAKEANEKINQKTKDGRSINLNNLKDWCFRRWNELGLAYDKETNHSLNKEKQYYWEYKIDSLYTKDVINENLKDDYSGISCYFPSIPNQEIYVDSFMMRKVHILDKYNMRFRFLTDYDFYADANSYKEYYNSILLSNGFINIQIKETLFEGMSSLESYCSDTVGNREFHDRIIFAPPYKYHLTVNYPLNTDNDTLYKQMKEQFFNSLSISNNDDYWINRFKQTKTDVMQRADLGEEDRNEDYSTLVTKGESNYSILYHRPIRFDEYLLIPIYPVKHTYNEIESFILYSNGHVFSQDIDSINGIICIKENELPSNKSIKFGYTLKSDSIDNIYDLCGTIY